MERLIAHYVKSAADCAYSSFPTPRPLCISRLDVHMAIVGLVPTGFSSCFSRGGGIAARDDGTVCVCAQLHCLWMGGCADVTPNSMADFHGECGDGDVVFFFFFSSWSATIFSSQFAVCIQNGCGVKGFNQHHASHLRWTVCGCGASWQKFTLGAPPCLPGAEDAQQHYILGLQLKVGKWCLCIAFIFFGEDKHNLLLQTT